MKISINPSKPPLDTVNSGNIGNVSGVGIINFEVDDILGVVIASDLSGGIGIRSSSVVAENQGHFSIQ